MAAAKFSPEVVDAILDATRLGKTLVDAANAAGVARRSLERWLAESREADQNSNLYGFAEAYDAAVREHKLANQAAIRARYGKPAPATA